MKAIQLERFGGPEVMEIRDVADPVPGPGQLLVRHGAVGVNYIDTYYRSGMYSANLPFIPGQEGAGTVEGVGPSVKGVKVGDRVAYVNIQGSYAERIVIPADRAVPVPARLDFERAAAVILQGMTAQYLVNDTCPLQKGDTVLVHAAAGGVGLLLVQTARMRGASVIATVSTAEKEELARGAGAQEVIRYTEKDFVAEVKRLTGGAGVRAVFDAVGKDTFAGSIECLSRRGMLVLYGQSSGKVESVDPARLARDSLFFTRPTLAHYIADTETLRKRASDVFGWAASGKLSVRIGARFPLAEAAEAHRQLQTRKTTGKVILTV